MTFKKLTFKTTAFKTTAFKTMPAKAILMGAMMMHTAAWAQTFDFDLTRQQPLYSAGEGYGYDILPAPTAKGSEPFYFSVKLPDGNYKVSVKLGSKKKAGNTTVRAESRRLMAEHIVTQKGKFQTVEFVVNKRTPEINDKMSVKLKPREKGSLTWDEKLTLEFNGESPAVCSIHIERDTLSPTIYLCGNSTVTDQGAEPWASWGQMFPRWFNDGVVIANHAESGLTAGTFIAQNRLAQIMESLRPGDIVICEFGHNDEKEKGPGSGAWYHYSRNLKIFVDNVRKKKAEIIFCTPTQRRNFAKDGKHITDTHGDFPKAMKTVAEREKVPVIDLNAMTRTFFETLGEEDSKRSLVHYPANTFPNQEKPLADNTHFNPYGAYEISKMVVQGLKNLQHPITQYLRSDAPTFNPAEPDDWRTFQWAPAKTADLVKPDGN